jgi:glycosyltransferase involved in cell wall biosynthesis
MKVLLISKACIAGAAQRKLEAIAAQGVELTAVVPPYWRDDAGRKAPLERAHTDGYRLVVEPMAFNGHFHYHVYPRLGRWFREARPDVVHMDEEPYNAATLHAFWLARRHGARPLFFTWQNLVRRYPPPFRWIERYCYRHAAGAIAGNGEAVDVLRRKGYAGRTWVIPQFGVDLELFRRRPPLRGPRPRAHGAFTVGWCSGRLRPEKGVHLLVEAVASLEDDTRLEILGWGPEEARLRTLAAQRGLGDRFRISPAVPSEQVPGFLSGIDALAQPSVTFPNWKEQFGRVLMEAMACEVPVVGSDSGEIARVIGDAGLVFPEGDVPALADGLRRLRDNPGLRSELATRGLARVRASFTQTQIAAQTVAAYREVLTAQ